MPRSFSCSALILRSRPSGESNRDVWLLAAPGGGGADAEAGLLRVTVFGGPKSKLRAHAAPFHSGQVWIYRDPVKDSRKLSDFDVRCWRPGLRELYERAMAADAVAETILASHGGGGHWDEALSLAEGVLDALESANEELCARLVVYFFWQWIGFLGLQPELEHCVCCGAAIARDAPLWYSAREEGLVCARCRNSDSGGADDYRGDGGLLTINPGCRRWLAAAGALPPAQLTRCSLDSQSFREARTLTTAILSEALGKRPVSWDF